MAGLLAGVPAPPALSSPAPGCLLNVSLLPAAFQSRRVAFASLTSLVLLLVALAGFGMWHFLRSGQQQHRYSRVQEMKQGDV